MTLGLSEIPAHVPPSLVRDIDVFADRRLVTAPYAFFREMAEFYPEVFFTPRQGGHWIVVGKRAAEQALKDYELFGNVLMSIPRSEVGPPQFIPSQVDPPEHTAYRRLLNPMFGPKAIWGLEGAIRELARTLIAAVVAQGECNFVKQVALPLPVRIFMRQMDLPEARYEEFASWVHEMVTGDTAERREAGTALSLEYIRGVVMEREPDPNGDWVRQLLAAEIDGRRLDAEREVWPICNLLFMGGLDTVKNALSHSVRTLAMRPDLQQRLREEPSVAPAAVEELFRFFGGTNPPRVIRRDADFMGAPLREGDVAIIYTPTATNEPRHIDDPSTVDFDREDKSHIAFGLGPHRCLGAVLARLELRVFLEEWFAMIPSFEIKPGSAMVFGPGLANSVEHLELRWPRKRT